MTDSSHSETEPAITLRDADFVAKLPDSSRPLSGPQAAPPFLNSESQPPLRWRELAALLLIVVLVDVTLYRGHGFAGYALFFAVAPLLLLAGAPDRKLLAAGWLIGGMTFLLAVRMVWLGDGLLTFCGAVLVLLGSMSLAGLQPHVLNICSFALQLLPAGCLAVAHYVRSLGKLRPPIPGSSWLKVVLPLAAVSGFGTLFVLANPDLSTAVRHWLGRLGDSLAEMWSAWSPDAAEVMWWIATAWVALGMLRPVLNRTERRNETAAASAAAANPAQPVENPLYAAFRNTLWSLIVLFAVYLVFEYRTLWFRVFPAGFYYSGYAHEGAAWLTAALALATVVLSAVFRGELFLDPRLARLKRLAWAWSALNLVLALAVYNRMFIYVDFNGMTRMRTVGLFGISAVVIGFTLVVWKIAFQRDFLWLIRRQLWTLAIVIYLFALTPVDLLVHSYNVRRVLAGDPAPSVQFSGVHPLDAGGYLVLSPLLESNDPLIREGVRALLAERAEIIDGSEKKRQTNGWTGLQVGERVLAARLRELASELEPYRAADRRQQAIQSFADYAYQWY